MGKFVGGWFDGGLGFRAFGLSGVVSSWGRFVCGWFVFNGFILGLLVFRGLPWNWFGVKLVCPKVGLS